MNERPAIPSQLRRDVLVEAGHRCAIPTCRQPTVEIAHIVPWERAREHRFENLIALCPNCHRRYDRGEIDRKAMLQYKANLTILNSRYGEVETRILHLFAENPQLGAIILPGDHYLHILYLLEDGLLAQTGQTSGIEIGGVPTALEYQLTDKGRQFVDKWLRAEELD